MHELVRAPGELRRPTFLAKLALPLGACLALGALGCGPSTPQPNEGLAAAAEKATVQTTVAGPVLQVSSQAGMPTQSTVADLVERLSPTVVNITTTQHMSRGPTPFDFFFNDGQPGQRGPRERQGAGTGFIVDPAGYVVTNAHVVRGADEVKVRLIDDREFSAEVVGRDAKLDLALLKIDGVDALPAVTLGDSDTLRVGEQVLAVGNPFGLGHTVTMGIVSAKARAIGAGPYDDFIQTDASINPGNSGGPLFNLRGEVVGINTAIRADANNIGFAIPVVSLKDVVPQLKKKGFVERGKLGLAFQAVTPEIADAVGLSLPHGAMVTDIMPGSSAAKAGIRSGDIIVGVDGVEIVRAEELPRNVARHAPGSTIPIQLLRGDKKLSVKATLDKLEEEGQRAARKTPKSQVAKSKDTTLGIEIEDAEGGGVRVVTLTKPQKGLVPGDVIVAVDGADIANVEALRKELRKHKGDTALFKIKRGDRARFVGVPVGK
jgi:serine protease Do